MPTRILAIRNVIRSLIETCRHGDMGFHAAAEGIYVHELRRELAEFGDERRGFVTDLEGILARCEVPEGLSDSTWKQDFGWNNLRQAVIDQDNDLILSECERSETIALLAYRRGLSINLSAQVRGMLEAQEFVVVQTHRRIVLLRDMIREGVAF